MKKRFWILLRGNVKRWFKKYWWLVVMIVSIAFTLPLTIPFMYAIKWQLFDCKLECYDCFKGEDGYCYERCEEICK